MKVVTFRDKIERSKYRIGAKTSAMQIIDLSQLISNDSLTAAQILACFDLEKDFDEWAKAAVQDDKLPKYQLAEIDLCAPVPRPGKIICVGLNYRDHAEESGAEIPSSPIIFSKFSTCVIGANEAILLPKESAKVDYEAELAVVIGRRAKNVNQAEAMNYVYGYTNFNDVSARDFQFADGQWQRGKSCDTFAPMGEFVATKEEIENPDDLSIQFRLNGETLQNSNTKELIFKIPEIIEFLTRAITLEPGDIIATGTPPGVGFARKPPIFLKDGDVTEVIIEGLGTLLNPVRAAENI